MALNVGELYALFTIDSAGAMTGLDNVSAKIAGIGTEISRVGLLWTNAFSRPITNFFKDSLQTGMSYAEEMQKSVAKMGLDLDTEEGQEAYRALDKEAMRVAKDSVYTTEQVAGAYDKMAMAGWDWQESVAALEAIMDLAAASGENVVTVSDIVTDAMTAFGYTMEAAGGDIKTFNKMVYNFVDVLAAAATSSNTDVGMMGEAFKYAGTMAGALNYNIEDVAVWLGLMANRGIKASQAGTTVRRVLSNLIKPTDEVAAVMNALNLSIDKDENGMYDLMSLMQQMRKSFNNIDNGVITTFLAESEGVFDDWEKKYSTTISAYDAAMSEFGDERKVPVDVLDNYNSALQELSELTMGLMQRGEFQHSDLFNIVNFASRLGGVRGMTGILALITASEEEFKGLIDEVYGSEGRANEMKTTMLDTAAGDLDMFLSSVNVLKTQIEELVDDKLRDLLQTAKGVIDSFIAMDDETKTTILQMAGVAAAIGPALVGIGALMRLLPSLGSMFSFVASPIGLVAIALGALAISALDSDNKISKAMSEIGKALGLDDADLDLSGIDITTMLDEFLGSIGDLSNNEAVQGFMSRLGEGFKGAMSAIGNIVGDLVGYILSPEGIADIFRAGVSLGKLLLRGLWDVLGGLTNLLSAIVNRTLIGMGITLDSEQREATKQAGEMLMAAYSDGIEKGADKAVTALQGAALLTTLAPEEIEEGTTAYDEAARQIAEAFDHISEAAGGIDYETFRNEIQGVFDSLEIDVPETLTDGFWQTLYNDLQKGYKNPEASLWVPLLESLLMPEEKTFADNAAMEAAKEMGITVSKTVAETVDDVVSAMDDGSNAIAQAGFAQAIVDEQQTAETAANTISDSVVKQFLLLMSEENGRLLGANYITAMAGAISDPDAILTSAASTSANAVSGTFSGVLSAENGASIGATFASGIAAGISNAIGGIQGQVAGMMSNISYARQMAANSAYQLSFFPSLRNRGATLTNQQGSQNATPEQIAAAVKNGIKGMTVQMDGVTVGNIVTPTVNTNLAFDASIRG